MRLKEVLILQLNGQRDASFNKTNLLITTLWYYSEGIYPELRERCAEKLEKMGSQDMD